MILGLGKRFCYTCGMEVGGNQHERFGKDFCSQEHAQQYTEQMQKARREQLEEARQTKSSGCG